MAGWYITSVFLVLIVRPKLFHAVDKRFMLNCMSDWLVAFRAQSSVDKKSCVLSFVTLDLPCISEG